MYKSVLLNQCPINYYNTNSIIVHMTSRDKLGPYTFSDVALRPRSPSFFDNSYVHAPFITRAPDGTFALFYETASVDHSGGYTTPNCTDGSHPAFPDPKSRRCMGVALSASLAGPWKRGKESILGDMCVPGGVESAADARDGGGMLLPPSSPGDVSNPAAIILPNSSALLLYRYEAVNHECIGVAFCPHYAGRW